MNERIRELAKQAGFYITIDGSGIFIPDPSTEDITEVAEKFAELIVKMCADAADMYEGQGDCIGDCVAEYMGYGEEEGVTEWRAK